MKEILSVKDLHKEFGAVRALDGLSFEVTEGEIFGLIGPDGAGKTTALRILAGIMIPGSGDVGVLGLRLPENAERVKEDIGYMSQRFNLYGDLTVRENIAFFADLFQVGPRELGERMKPLLEMTRLSPFMDRLAARLSGGMKQKLALICTLIHRPKLLLLDEPTTGVDPVSRREFWEILQEIQREGVTIAVSTPYMDEAEWCARIGLVFGGKMISCDTPAAMKAGFSGVAADVFPEGGAGSAGGFAGRLASAGGVLDSQLMGGRYHVIFKDGAALEKAKAELAGASVKSVPASIEDVFISKLKT